MRPSFSATYLGLAASDTVVTGRPIFRMPRSVTEGLVMDAQASHAQPANIHRSPPKSDSASVSFSSNCAILQRNQMKVIDVLGRLMCLVTFYRVWFAILCERCG